MTEPVQRPQKRARVDQNESESSQVKCERSPSPFLSERRLVTCGTKRFAPLPSDCLLSCPEYKQNRSQWVARCVKELETLDLIPEKRLIRDDGLIVDWRSHVPVWSDTLQPDSLDIAAAIVFAHRSNAKWHSISTGSQESATPISAQEALTSSSPVFGSVSDAAETLAGKKLPAPPRSRSKRRNNPSQPVSVISASSWTDSPFPCPDRSRLPDETRHETDSRPLLRDHTTSSADSVGIPSAILTQRVPPNSSKRVHDPSTAPSESSAEDEMSEMTLDYLRRYIQTYEEDRASLASAYARNASFAYRSHQNTNNTGGNASSTLVSCYSSGIKRTRLDIVSTLLTPPCLHSTTGGPSGNVQIEYDIFYLGAGLGMFAVCRAVIAKQTVIHNFVLQRKEVDEEDAAIDGVWPLTATAHQILVFQ